METSDREKRINKVLDNINLEIDKVGEKIIKHKIEIKEIQKKIGREVIKIVRTRREVRYSGSRREELEKVRSILRNKIEGNLEKIRRLDIQFGEVWDSL